MSSRLAVVLLSLLLVVLLLESTAIVWLCVAILPTRMAELCSDKCRCEAGRFNVDSTNQSLTKTSFNFLKYFRQLTISAQYIPSFGNDTFLLEGLTELEEISVKLSHLRTIELGALNGLTNLRNLDLFGNEISEILPGTFEKMIRLQNLNLQNNSIDSLNVDTFSGLISLVHLDLRINKLQYVHPDTFLSLPKLKIVNLYNNLGLQIPTDRNFISSNSLSELGIADCNVSSLSVETIANVSGLKWLDLSYNKLRTLDINILRALPKLSTLYLMGNPLQCDCQLKEVWRWCKDHNIQTVYEELAPKCDTPTDMKGMGLEVLEGVQCLQENI
jgi:Leucine-rich repeat (LRR) protein